MQGLERTALVIGGGIGGLAAGLALRRSGWAVELYEQAPKPRRGGWGLMVSPNGMQVLEGLGVAQQVVERGEVVTQRELCNWRGAPLASSPTRALYARLGAPAVLLQGAVLLELLLEALGAERVHRGARLVEYDDAGTEVWAALSGGSRARGEVLVGADGLLSAVRAQLHPADPLRYAGHACWHGLIRSFSHPALPVGMLRETQGRGVRFGAGYIDKQGQVSWWATVNMAEGARPPGGDKAFLLELFSTAHAPIPQLIAATEEADLLRSDTYDRLPISRWGEGRVTLLGDAAHPMTPDLGQGANSALEDAAALARALAEVHSRDMEQALREYEARRMRRTAWLQRASWLFGRVGQWEDPVAVWLRERVLRQLPRRWLERESERVWRWA